MSVEALYASVDSAQAKWEELVDLLSQGKYDLDRRRPLLGNNPLSLFLSQAALAFQLIQSLRPTPDLDARRVIMELRASEFQPHIDTIGRQADFMLSTLRVHWQAGNEIRDTNDGFNIQLFGPKASDHHGGFDFNDQFRQVQAAVNAVIALASQVLPVCKADGVSDLLGRADKLGETVREIDQLRRKAQDHEKAAELSQGKIAAHESNAMATVTQIETALAVIHNLQQQATTESSSVTALVERIKTVGSGAESLEQNVTSYQAKFSNFDQNLSERLNDLMEFEARKDGFLRANQEREDEIERLTREADAMIKGATTAGLAKSLEDARARYESRLNSSRKGFFVAVALLAFSALPLAAHLLPGLFGAWIPGLDPEKDGSPFGVLGKVLLLLPATWLTAFFTKNYAELFHTEREYAHKAALAMSVDGFKRQAPKYEEEITAEVFMEIRQNPGHGRDVEPATHPLYDVLSKTVEKVLGDKKGKGGGG